MTNALITGTCGFIGSQLSHQVTRVVTGRAMLDGEGVVLADIRDRHVITNIFIDRRPNVFLHAAAVKRLAFLERLPKKSRGPTLPATLQVREAARGCGVARFGNISTDKATNRLSVLGKPSREPEHIGAREPGGQAPAIVHVSEIVMTDASVADSTA